MLKCVLRLLQTRETDVRRLYHYSCNAKPIILKLWLGPDWQHMSPVEFYSIVTSLSNTVERREGGREGGGRSVTEYSLFVTSKTSKQSNLPTLPWQLLQMFWGDLLTRLCVVGSEEGGGCCMSHVSLWAGPPPPPLDRCNQFCAGSLGGFPAEPHVSLSTAQSAVDSQVRARLRVSHDVTSWLVGESKKVGW